MRRRLAASAASTSTVLAVLVVTGLAAQAVRPPPAVAETPAGCTQTTTASAQTTTTLAQTSTAPAATTALSSSTPDPSPSPRPTVDPVHLPVLHEPAAEPACTGRVAVQNIGARPTKVALLTWGATTTCAPRCDGPTAVLCSGLIGAGEAWYFPASSLPAEARTGMVFSLGLQTFVPDRDVGTDSGAATAGGRTEMMDRPPLDGTAADLVCAALATDVVGSCDGFRHFKTAYKEHTRFAGLPMGQAYGSPLAVEVERRCPGEVHKTLRATAGYAGLSGRSFGGYHEVFRYPYYQLAPAYVDHEGWRTTLHLQNAGLHCASVEVYFRSYAACRRERLRRTLTLAPGASTALDTADLVEPGWRGGVRVASSEPLAVLADLIGPTGRMSYTAEPSELRYAFAGPPIFTAGSAVLYGPLVRGGAGWTTRVHVRNLDQRVEATVTVVALTSDGTVQAEVTGVVCPHGSRAFTLEEAPPAGTLRVESRGDWDADGRRLTPPNLSAVAELVRGADDTSPAAVDRDPTGGALTYNLLTEPQAFDWPRGSTAGGTFSGVAHLALPSVVHDPDVTGTTTQISLANVVPVPGHTDVVLFLLDANGAVAHRCLQLGALEVRTVRLDRWLNGRGPFRGSALVKAVGFSHPVAVYDRRGAYTRNLVGMTAAAVRRTPRRRDTPHGADGLSVVLGVPLEVRRAQPATLTLDPPDCSLDTEGPPPRLTPSRLLLPAVGR